MFFTFAICFSVWYHFSAKVFSCFSFQSFHAIESAFHSDAMSLFSARFFIMRSAWVSVSLLLQSHFDYFPSLRFSFHVFSCHFLQKALLRFATFHTFHLPRVASSCFLRHCFWYAFSFLLLSSFFCRKLSFFSCSLLSSSSFSRCLFLQDFRGRLFLLFSVFCPLHTFSATTAAQHILLHGRQRLSLFFFLLRHESSFVFFCLFHVVFLLLLRFSTASFIFALQWALMPLLLQFSRRDDASLSFCRCLFMRFIAAPFSSFHFTLILFHDFRSSRWFRDIQAFSMLSYFEILRFCLWLFQARFLRSSVIFRFISSRPFFIAMFLQAPRLYFFCFSSPRRSAWFFTLDLQRLLLPRSFQIWRLRFYAFHVFRLSTLRFLHFCVYTESPPRFSGDWLRAVRLADDFFCQPYHLFAAPARQSHFLLPFLLRWFFFFLYVFIAATLRYHASVVDEVIADDMRRQSASLRRRQAPRQRYLCLMIIFITMLRFSSYIFILRFPLLSLSCSSFFSTYVDGASHASCALTFLFHFILHASSFLQSLYTFFIESRFDASFLHISVTLLLFALVTTPFTFHFFMSQLPSLLSMFSFFFFLCFFFRYYFHFFIAMLQIKADRPSFRLCFSPDNAFHDTSVGR